MDKLHNLSYKFNDNVVCDFCRISACNCSIKKCFYATSSCEASGTTNLGQTISATATASATSNISKKHAKILAQKECTKVVNEVLFTQISLVNISQDFNFPVKPIPDAPLEIYPELENISSINYYNTKSLAVQDNLNNMSAWQGIQYLGSDTYLMCGTSNPNPTNGQGVIYVGNINCINGQTYILNVPNPNGGFFYTSIYGPNYDIYTGIYTFVGSYTETDDNIKGFVYQGTLEQDSLTNPSNFIYFNDLYFENNDITFLHSINGDYLVGNTFINNGSLILDFKTFVWNFKKSTPPVIFSYPNSTISTTYGIIKNSDYFTIVGGYSNGSSTSFNPEDISDIFPLTYGFLATFNPTDNSFSNYTSVSYNSTTNFITHFQGVDKFNNTDNLELCADVLDITKPSSNTGYYTLAYLDKIKQKYIVNPNWVNINYKGEGITSANSVANASVIGLYKSLNSNQCYQSNIQLKTCYSATNTKQFMLENNERLKFNNIITNSFIDYNNTDSTFIFIRDGIYSIDLNIYFKNLTIPAGIFTIYYTVKKNNYNFSISAKGIGETGINTAHSMLLPASFSCYFYAGDTIYVQNNSGDAVSLVESSVKNTVCAMININKLTN